MSINLLNVEDTSVSESVPHLLNISRSNFYIIHQIEYWFKRKPDGFYKFLEPCHHRLYREGDSWAEALGIHRKTFNRFFDLIGVRYKSKTAFLSSQNKFQGKLYASYYHRLEKKTFYVRNDELAEAFIQAIKSKNRVINKNKSALPNGKIVRSNIDIDISIHKETTVMKNSMNAEPSDAYETEGRLIKIWNDFIDPSQLKNPLSVTTRKALLKAFENAFQSNLKNWEDYCIRISKNKFLMGGGERGWKATLEWAIKPENIKKVLDGVYETYGAVSESISIPPLTINDIEALQGEGTWKDILRSLSKRIGLPCFKSWFADLIPTNLESEITQIRAHSRFVKDRISTYYYDDLMLSLREFLPFVRKVEIVAP
jgi:hypothetical protein